MKVTLINYTREAMETLIFTKNTRLEMNPALMREITLWPYERKLTELEYMSRTIPSSWEMIDYIFLLNGVTRAFTHQLVRTRHGSYAQQTMRVLRVSKDKQPFRYTTGPTIENNPEALAIYTSAMRMIDQAYNTILDKGALEEDARGILPTNIETNICAKFNLRTLAEFQIKRGTSRTQTEYRQALMLMRAEVYKVHPWAKMFLEPERNVIVAKLIEIANSLRATHLGPSNAILKEVELLQKEFNNA